MSTETKSTELVAVETAVTSMNKLTEGLADLSKRYKGVVYDVTTTKGMTEAKAARREIAGPRIEVERIRKAAKAPILDLGRKLDAEAARITRELEAIEAPIDAQIRAEENRVEAERQAKIKAEQDRVAAIVARIEAMKNQVTRAMVAKASGEIVELMNQVDAVVIDATFDTYQSTAADTKAQVYEQLDKLHAAAIAREEEAERLAKERAELDRWRAEQEERDRKAREDQARIDTLKGRVAAIRGHVEAAQTMRTSAEIARLMVTVSARSIGPLEFGEFVQEACQAQLETMNRLQVLHIAAKDREAEEARQQQVREEQAAAQKKLDDERREFEARQQREREEREARERAEQEARDTKAREEREAQERREREAEEQRARNYVPTAEELVAALMVHFKRDAATVNGWLRERFSAKRKAA